VTTRIINKIKALVIALSLTFSLAACQPPATGPGAEQPKQFAFSLENFTGEGEFCVQSTITFLGSALPVEQYVTSTTDNGAPVGVSVSNFAGLQIRCEVDLGKEDKTPKCTSAKIALTPACPTGMLKAITLPAQAIMPEEAPGK